MNYQTVYINKQKSPVLSQYVSSIHLAVSVYRSHSICVNLTQPLNLLHSAEIAIITKAEKKNADLRTKRGVYRIHIRNTSIVCYFVVTTYSMSV